MTSDGEFDQNPRRQSGGFGVISKYAVPQTILFVDQLDHFTSVGKIDKKALRKALHRRRITATTARRIVIISRKSGNEMSALTMAGPEAVLARNSAYRDG